MLNDILYNSFSLKRYFIHVCDLMPNKEKKKLSITIIDEENYRIKNLVYIFVIDGTIYKVGETKRSIRERINNYNSGNSKKSGSTNQEILNDFIKKNKEVNVFIYSIPENSIFGEKYYFTYSSKVVELLTIARILNDFKKLPVGNKY